MIPVTELMVGNEVIINDQVFNPNGRAPYRYTMTAFDLYKIEDADGENGVFPIPLTPEILEKAGLKQDDPRGYLLRIGGLQMFIRFNAGHCYSECGGIYLGDRITNLHQLQNLYFALTGQHLNIQL